MILFIGNVLSEKGRAVSYTEFLVGQLRKVVEEEIELISSYRNKILRLAHASFFLVQNRIKIRLVVIDTFSTSAFYYAYVMALLCRLLNKNYILVLHGGNLPERYKRSPLLVNRIFNHADRIISPSFYLAHFFVEAGFIVEVIPNALDIDIYPFKKRSNIRPRILWVRAFDKIYNPVLAIKALRLLLDQFPTATLTMVGPVKDSSYETCVAYAKQHGLEKTVTFRGLLNRDQWIKESADFDIFINTTTIDNQPVSLLEAMALGFLVASTNVGGIPFLVEDAKNGFLVPSNDEQALAKTIQHLLDMSKVNIGEVSSRAREFAEQFDWRRIESKWLVLLV
jgi:L-malate glycosyltransferase